MSRPPSVGDGMAAAKPAGSASADDRGGLVVYCPETPRLIGEMNGVLQVPPMKNED